MAVDSVRRMASPCRKRGGKGAAVTKGASWVRLPLVTGYAFLCLGWLLAFSWFGVAAFLAGGVLVIGAAIGDAVATRSISRLLVPVAIGVLLFFVFPITVNTAFWAGRGFQGPDGGSTGIQTPTGRP